MSLRRTRVENIALTMIERDGIAVIWELHLIAAKADREESKASAAAIIEIAEAAEREWRRENGRAEPMVVHSVGGRTLDR